jgi:hypothetical protein
VTPALRYAHSIGLGVEVLVADESLRRPPDDASEDRLHVLVARRRDGDEPRRAITGLRAGGRAYGSKPSSARRALTPASPRVSTKRRTGARPSRSLGTTKS